MNTRVRAVVRKEFREYRRNRMIALTMTAVPAVFLAIPLVGVLLLQADTPEKDALMIAGVALLLFLIVPLLIPSTVAAYSVIGDREEGTLEPTLTTPVSDRELLLGKAIAALIPAIAISWVLFGVFILVAWLFAAPVVVQAMWQTELPLAVLLAPVLAGLSIVLSLAISVRSTDIRVAEQLSAWAWLPIALVLAAIAYGFLAPSKALFLIGLVVLLAVDVIGWRLSAALFDRERLLTRSPGPHGGSSLFLRFGLTGRRGPTHPSEVSHP